MALTLGRERKKERERSEEVEVEEEEEEEEKSPVQSAPKSTLAPGQDLKGNEDKIPCLSVDHTEREEGRGLPAGGKYKSQFFGNRMRERERNRKKRKREPNERKEPR